MSLMLRTTDAPPPWSGDPEPDKWVDVGTFAREYRRSKRTVQHWCSTGYILNFCIATYRDISGKWWLRLSS